MLDDKKNQAVEDLKRIDAVKEREGNSELSDEEAWDIVLQEEEESKQESILKDPFSFDNEPAKKLLRAKSFKRWSKRLHRLSLY
jgi:hypothetical protein